MTDRKEPQTGTPPFPTIVVPASFDSRADARAAVQAWEASFSRCVTETAARISRECVRDGVRVIRLTGPTCSGKTTAAAKLTDALERVGCAVYPISLDDFFFDRAVLDARLRHDTDRPDYDSAAALDLPLMEACIRSLLGTGCADMPVFRFETGRREGYRRLTVSKDRESVLLCEGIQAAYPEMADMLAGFSHRSVFISVLRGIQVGDVLFAPEEIRLMRRLVRDEDRRNASPSLTMSLWHGVRANEISSILPFAMHCDTVIDSAMAFEVHMLAPHLRRIFTQYPVAGTEAETVAADLLDRLAGVEGIPSGYLSPDSFYHEFLRA